MSIGFVLCSKCADVPGRRERCRGCGGRGWVKCGPCKGSGYVDRTDDDTGPVVIDVWKGRKRKAPAVKPKRRWRGLW